MEKDEDFVSWSQKPIVAILYQKYQEFATRYQIWLVIKFAQEQMQNQLLKGNDINIPKFGTFSPRTMTTYVTFRMIFFKPDFHFLTLLKQRQIKNF